MLCFDESHIINAKLSSKSRENFPGTAFEADGDSFDESCFYMVQDVRAQNARCYNF